MKADLPDLAFCVGDRTAWVARQMGFATVSAKGDAAALVDLILSQPKSPLLHLCGREVRGDLAGPLSSHGIEVQDLMVYAQEEQPLSEEAAALLRHTQPVLMPIFSPRTARLLQAECHRVGAKAPVLVIAMSAAVAEAATGLSHTPPQVAAYPDGESMLAAVVDAWVAGQGP